MTRRLNFLKLIATAVAFDVLLSILGPSMLSQAFAVAPSNYLSRSGQHRLLTDNMPPGVVGQSRLSGPGPVHGYFQPVAFSGPPGIGFSMPESSNFFGEPNSKLQAGLMVGGVYRFRITGIPNAEGAELYPTIELIDRTYPPPGLATSYPIVINLDQDDFEAALDGQMVTRVIYLEDPSTAVPLAQTPTTSQAIDLAEHQDALEVADRFGRPMAIVRIGSVAPPSVDALMPQFFFGYPLWAPIYQSNSPAVQ